MWRPFSNFKYSPDLPLFLYNGSRTQGLSMLGSTRCYIVSSFPHSTPCIISVDSMKKHSEGRGLEGSVWVKRRERDGQSEDTIEATIWPSRYRSDVYYVTLFFVILLLKSFDDVHMISCIPECSLLFKRIRSKIGWEHQMVSTGSELKCVYGCSILSVGSQSFKSEKTVFFVESYHPSS